MNDRITQLLNQDPLILQALREDISSEDVTTGGWISCSAWVAQETVEFGRPMILLSRVREFQ